MMIEDKLLANEGSIFLGQRRVVVVENHNDDNQSDCVGEGELRVLGAFGDSSESVGSPTVALAALSVSSLNLISVAVI